MNKFILTLDDFCPTPSTGLNFESIAWCDLLIGKYPSVKIYLFVSAAFCRLGRAPSYLSQNKAWVKTVNNLPSNYKICPHGMFHRRTSGKHPASNNDEMQYLNKKEAEAVIKQMLDEFKKAGLKYEKIFRAPGWKISNESAQVLTDYGFIIAGDEKYCELTKNVCNIRYVKYNWDLNDECKLINKDILATGHTSNWTSNYFCGKTYSMVANLLAKNEFYFDTIESFLKE